MNSRRTLNCGRDLNRKLCFVFAFVSLVSVLAVWYFYSYLTPTVLREDFERGFGEWVPDADVPLDPNNPGYAVEWRIERVKNFTYSGDYWLMLFIDGRQDDGTIWIERKISVRGNSQVKVDVSFQFYSDGESFNTIAGVVAYAGVRNPEAEGDFVVLGPANEVAGWKEYSHTTVLDADSQGQLWVAVGITVRWETFMAYFVDDVEITIE